MSVCEIVRVGYIFVVFSRRLTDFKFVMEFLRINDSERDSVTMQKTEPLKLSDQPLLATLSNHQKKSPAESSIKHHKSIKEIILDENSTASSESPVLDCRSLHADIPKSK